MTAPTRGTEPGLSRESLVSDLRAVGLQEGQVVLVHASLRKIGQVSGGARTVVTALREVIGPTGTLVVATGTAGNSDTSRAYLAAVSGMSDDQIRQYRAAMPAFDPATTPSQGMGQIAEQVRITPGAARSAHPQSSFAALGPIASFVTDNHDISCHLGESSPVGRLYEIGAQILLLGADYPACSAFHLAEYRYAPHPPTRSYRCVIPVNGQAVWHEYQDVVLDDRDLEELGADFEQAGLVTRGCVGQADSRLTPVRVAVDYATEWLRQYRRDVAL